MVDLSSLNEAQRKAVTHGEGPMMVLAGAGSGKTRVLTYRIAHLMDNGVDPFNILALTFTNKAAREMKGRIEQASGPEARNLWMGTFHSVFSKILREEGHRIGYPRDFTIYDTDDSKSLIRTIVKGFNLDDKLYKPNMVLSRISAAKNGLISTQQYLDDPVLVSEDHEAQRPEIGRIYHEYVTRCFRANAMDFDDLLFNTHVLFREHPGVLNVFQSRFKYVLVDEFQDTNHSQYTITKKLAARYQNICVVGDDAQSIYGFRGADISNILNFEKDYSDLRVFKLEQNYRSTKTIVAAANSVIRFNQAQLPKEVWTDNSSGEKIDLIRATSDSEEGRLIASGVFQHKMNNQLRYEDFAVLYRTNAQSRAIEESLRKMNIPYRIYGGLSFYQRKEIKDVIAYLRFIINPQDEEAFKRIINFPKRGIGPTTVAKVAVLAAENNTTQWDILQKAKGYFPKRAGDSLDGFATLIKKFRLDLETKNAYEVADSVLRLSGLSREYYEDKSIEGMARYENIQELLSGIREFVDTPDDPENLDENGNPIPMDRSLSAFLQDIALLTDADQDDEDNDRVVLMTIHSAKGLEFKSVFLSGLEEDLFPSQMMMNSRADLEEERRLFYVAITRAEQKLTLSYAITRYRYGMLKSCEPSRFFKEIPENLINSPRKYSESRLPGNSAAIHKPFRAKKTESKTPVGNLKPISKANKIHRPDPNFKPSDPSTILAGMKVEHQKFGFGKVARIEEYNQQKKAVIEFDNFGQKTLLLSFAKLKIHS